MNLIDAIRANNLEELNKCIQAGENPSIHDNEALILAVQLGYEVIVKRLLQISSVAKNVDVAGDYPLILASSYKDKDQTIARLLLSTYRQQLKQIPKFAKHIDSVRKPPATPSVEILKKPAVVRQPILEVKQKADTVTENESTLLKAVKDCNWSYLARVKDSPKVLNTIDENDHQALRCAMTLKDDKDKKTAKMLLGAYDKAGKKYWPGVYKDEILKAHILQSLSTKAGLKKPQMMTLQIAAETDNMEALTFFIDSEAVLLENGSLALICAARSGHEAFVSRLLECPAVIAQVNARDHEALKVAIQNKHSNIVFKLLDVYFSKKLPLSDFIRSNIEIITQLVHTRQAQALPAVKQLLNIKDDIELLHWALANNHAALATSLVGIASIAAQAAANENLALYLVIKQNSFGRVQQLIAIPNVKKNIVAQNHRILQEAIKQGSQVVDAVLTVYIEQGASLAEHQSLLRDLINSHKNIDLAVIKKLIQAKGEQPKNDVELFFWSLENQYLGVAMRLVNTAAVKKQAHIGDNQGLYLAVKAHASEVATQLLENKFVQENIAAAGHRVLQELVNCPAGNTTNIGKKVIDIYFENNIAIPDFVAKSLALSKYVAEKNRERTLGTVLLDACEKGDLQCLRSSIGSQDKHVLEQYGMRALNLAIIQLNLLADDKMGYLVVDQRIDVIRYLLRFEAIQRNIDHQDHSILRLVLENKKEYYHSKIGKEILKIYFFLGKCVPDFIANSSNKELATCVPGYRSAQAGCNDKVREIIDAKRVVDDLTSQVNRLDSESCTYYGLIKDTSERESRNRSYFSPNSSDLCDLVDDYYGFKEWYARVNTLGVASLFIKKFNADLEHSKVSSNIRSDTAWAVRRRDSDSVRTLLNASYNASDFLLKEYGCSEAINAAVECGYPDMAVLLYKRATAVGLKVGFSINTLLPLAKVGDIDFLRQLCSNGIPIIHRLDYPKTLELMLSTAAENGHFAFIQNLISIPEVGRYLMDKNNFSQNCGSKINPLNILYAAAKSGNPEILALLLQVQNIKECLERINISHLIECSIESNNVMMVQSILNLLGVERIKVDKNIKYAELFSKATAIKSGSEEIIHLMLSTFGEEQKLFSEQAWNLLLDGKHDVSGLYAVECYHAQHKKLPTLKGRLETVIQQFSEARWCEIEKQRMYEIQCESLPQFPSVLGALCFQFDDTLESAAREVNPRGAVGPICSAVKDFTIAISTIIADYYNGMATTDLECLRKARGSKKT